MTDRELLELAAKASGISLTGEGRSHLFNVDAYLKYTWNPLDDDGDALRLAVKLRLIVHTPSIDTVYVKNNNGQLLGRLVSDGDHYAATRRAIVIAAAEIGKSL